MLISICPSSSFQIIQYIICVAILCTGGFSCSHYNALLMGQAMLTAMGGGATTFLGATVKHAQTNIPLLNL